MGHQFKYKYCISLVSLMFLVYFILQMPDVQATSKYSDVPDDAWYTDYVEQASDNNMFNGYDDGTFRPNNPITRAQFVVLLARCANADLTVYQTSTPIFADVSNSALWYYGAVQWATENGITKGVEKTCFAPDQSLTRQEVAVMVMRYLELNGYSAEGTQLQYKDAAEIAPWAIIAIRQCAQLSLMEGTADNQFLPENIITRGEAAKVIVCLNAVIDQCDVQSIASIKVSHYGFGTIIREFKVDLTTAICYDFSSTDYTSIRDELAENAGYQTLVPAEGSTQELLHDLADANVLNWEAIYNEAKESIRMTEVPCVEVVFCFENNVCKKTYCEGVFPEEWNDVRLALKNYVGYDILFYDNS